MGRAQAQDLVTAEHSLLRVLQGSEALRLRTWLWERTDRPAPSPVQALNPRSYTALLSLRRPPGVTAVYGKPVNSIAPGSMPRRTSGFWGRIHAAPSSHQKDIAQSQTSCASGSLFHVGTRARAWLACRDTAGAGGAFAAHGRRRSVPPIPAQ